MKRKSLLIITLLVFLASGFSFAEEYKKPVPNRSGRVSSERNTPNLTPPAFGVDGQGNTSILTPNHSRGYIGFDSQGNALIITPLRGNLGIDSRGTIWTIRGK